MDYEIAYDVSKFLDASIDKVLHTLLEAFILVSLVVFLFLGDVRSTLIPILAVPVSLVGTFFVLQLMGLSINLITLFALVLAIGVVVDDAIVVVEAVHAKMAEKHLSPYRATMEVLHEISGAIIAITLVMTSVFVPVTFIPGPVGTFYRQFGITMATSIILSGLVALTLTPVLCAMILKPHSHTNHTDHTHHVKKRRGLKVILLYVCGGLLVLGPITYLGYYLWGPLGFLLILVPFVQRPFDRAVEKVTGGYAGILRRIVTRRVLTMAVVGGFAAGIFVVNLGLPTGFIPGEDQGIIYAVIQTPPGSTLEYTNEKAQKLEEIAKEVKEVTSVTSLAGYEVLTEGRGSNAGTCIINLKNWSDRKRTAHQIIEELEEKCGQISNVKLEFFEPPAVPGFGAAGGFSVVLLDKTNTSNYKQLGEVTDNFMAALKKRKELKNLFTFFATDYPQYELIIDNDVAMQKGVSIGKAMDNLNIYIGSTYEQGFILFNQFYKVYVQAAPEYRRFPEDLDNMFVKNDHGDMVPYSSFMKIKKKQGLNEITRYNLYPSATIQGAPAPGFSSGQALKAIQEVADADAATRLRPRLGRSRLRRVEKGERVGRYLFHRRRLRLSGTGRAIREFHPAAGRDPVSADRALRFLLVPAGHGIGQRRLRPDRSGHAGRSAGQERDLDRRIRGPTAPGGRVPQGCSHRRRKTALPADSDDLLRLHRRSDSVGLCHRRRGDRKPHHWRHRSRRDARGHRDRSLGNSRPLLLVRWDCRRAQTHQGRIGRTPQ